MQTMIIGEIDEGKMPEKEFIDTLRKCLFYLASESEDAGLKSVSDLLEECAIRVKDC